MRNKAFIGSLVLVLLLALGPAGGFDSATAGGGTRSSSGSETADYLSYEFVPITPYRAWDTRTDARIETGQRFAGIVGEDVDGVRRLPIEAAAVTFTITVTQTAGAGYLAVYPAGTDWPGNSSINWVTSGIDLANSGVSAVADDYGMNELIVMCGGAPGASTHFIIDITGFFI